MMKQRLLTLIACIISLSLPAQKNTYPGYYINLEGDTVRGTIFNFSGFEKSPEAIQFDNGKQPIVLTPSNCRFVALNGFDSYISYNGKRAINASSLANSTVFDSAYRYETVNTFLMLAFNSPDYKLAILRDSKRDNLFLIKGQDAPVELLYRVNYVNTTLDEIRTYRQQLANILANEIQANPKISGRIAQADYTESDLVGIFKKIGGNVQGTAAASNRGEFYVLAGVSYSMLKVKPEDNIDPFAQADYNKDLSPSIAIGYNIYTKRRLASWFLSPQFKYFHAKHSGGGKQAITNYQIDYTMETHSIFVGIFIGKNWINNEKTTFYTSFGPGLVNNLSYKRLQTITTTSNTTTRKTDTESVIKPGYYFQAGLMFSKHFGAWSAFKVPTSLGNYGIFDVKSTSIQAGLEIRL